MRLPSFRLTRDLATYLVGIAGVVNEVVFQEFDPGRVAYFVGFLSLLGAPYFLRRDEARATEPAPPPRPQPPEPAP